MQKWWKKKMPTKGEARKSSLVLLGLLPLLAFGFIRLTGQSDPQLDLIELPPGFVIEVYASDVPGARSLALGPAGTVFVGSMGPGRVYALTDRDGDGHADESITVASGLNVPNGVAFRDGALYVAEISRVLRFDDIEARLDRPPDPVVVNDGFPTERLHGWKFIAFGPDGMLYIPVGAPCNICKEDDERFASIMRMNPDGSEPEVFAHGVRNSVGFDWHPETGELWFTDNGRDRALRNGTRLHRVHAACQAAGTARGIDRHALLHRLDLPGDVSERDLHRRARLLEPEREDRLPRDVREVGRRRGGRLRAVCPGVATGRGRLGPTLGPPRDARRLATRVG